MKATLFINSWAGRHGYDVTIIKETPKKYLITWDNDSCFRFIKGNKYYVPKYSVKFREVHDKH